MPEKKSTKKIKKCLDKYYDMNPTIQEIGIDEAGRGPMFGRVYAAAVILPKDGDFDYSLMKDSKKFTSVKKITEELIKKFPDADGIDKDIVGMIEMALEKAWIEKTN